MILLLLACGCPPVGQECINDCPDYTRFWTEACPSGSRCIQVHNASASETVYVSYQVGCNGDGTPGSPQCNCTSGPTLAPGATSYFVIMNGDYTSCDPYSPSCLTEGLALIANTGDGTCASGTRVEFSAGNEGDPYGKFDSYNLDVEKNFYSIPVAFAPILSCANDIANHDCRPLYCNSSTCPDAYATPTAGGCPDGRSPQVGCQDTFANDVGFMVTYFPPAETSCRNAVPCQ